MGLYGRRRYRASRVQRWSGNGVCSVNFNPGDELPGDLRAKLGIPQDAEGTIEMSFSSEGYYDPGVCSGPVESCYPPEGEDERIVNEAIVYWGDDNTHIDLSEKDHSDLLEALQLHYEEKIQEANFDNDGSDDRDYDDYREQEY